MIEKALAAKKNAETISKPPVTPVNPEYHTGSGYEKNTVKAVKETVNTTVNGPRINRKVLSDEGTKKLIDVLTKPRQNRRPPEPKPQPKPSPTEETAQPLSESETEPQQQPEIEPDRPIIDQDFEFNEPDNDDTSHLLDDEDLDGEGVNEDTTSSIPDPTIEYVVDTGITQIDIYLPKLLAWLNEIEDSERYKAEKESIAEIKKHAVLFAKQHKTFVANFTPAQALAFAVAMAYLPGIVSGLFHRSPQILKYVAGGFKSATKPLKETQNDDGYHPYTEVEPTCLHKDCNKTIKKGQSFPKSSKHTELVGKFCNNSHFKSYCNYTGIMGRGANK